MEQNKTELVLWEVYNIVRSLNDSDLDEVQILINRERTDRIKNKNKEFINE